MKHAASVVVFAACASSTEAPSAPIDVPRNTARSDLREDACEMLAAILAVPEYQRFYRGVSCGDERQRLLVKVVALPSVVPPETNCPRHEFDVFHGERDVQGAVLVIGVGADPAGDYRFSGWYEQPNPTVNPDGSIDAANYYCGLLGSKLEKRNGRWIAHAFKDRP